MTLDRLTQITSVGITSGITLNNATLTGVTTIASLDGVSISGVIAARDTIDAQGNVTVGAGLSVVGISTLGNTVVGGATTELVVNGDARITGILTIGTASVTIDSTNNTITASSFVGNVTGDVNSSGVSTVTTLRSNNIGVNTNSTQTAEVYIAGAAKTEGLIISEREEKSFTPLVIENFATKHTLVGVAQTIAVPIIVGKRYSLPVDTVDPSGYDGTYFEFNLGNGDGLFNIVAGARWDRATSNYYFEGERGAGRIFLQDGSSPKLYGSTVGTGITGAAVTWNQVYPPPTFRARQSSTQTINNGTNVKITFTTEDFDTHGFYDTSTSRFQPTIPGYYFISANIRMGTGSTNARIDINLFIDGSLSNYASGQNQTNSNDMSASINTLVYLNGSQYLEVYANQNSGSNLSTSLSDNLGGTVTITHFSGYLVHPA